MTVLGEDLSQDEVLHIAIEAMRRQDHGSAISYLKEGLKLFPEDGKMAYMLGAEYAQIGLYDKAEETMELAISIEPSLYTAVFQLGLLQLTLGKVAEAKSTWQKLNELPEDHALYLFKSGLEYFSESNFTEAKRLIDLGIANNTFSPELTIDMQKVLLEIPSDVAGTSVETDANVGHVWLSAYNSTDKH